MKESSKYIIATLKCKNVGPAKLLKYIKESNFDLNVFKKKLVTFLSDENPTKIRLNSDEFPIRSVFSIIISLVCGSFCIN